MTTRADLLPFRVSDAYDRDQSSDGESRYAAYVRKNISLFADLGKWFDDPKTIGHEYAAAAWKVANGPIMAPGLVGFHPRIADVSISRSDWDGELNADLTFYTDWPAELQGLRHVDGSYLGDWRWSDWMQRFEGPSGEDIAKRPYLLTTARLILSLPAGTVPTIGDDQFPDLKNDPTTIAWFVQQARLSLAQLVEGLNQVVQPIINRLEGR
jgi:hypothetical protein